MTEHWRHNCPGTMRPLVWAALLITGAMLQGCGHDGATGSAGPRLRVYAADVTGAAKACEAPKVDPAKSPTSEVGMTVVNDGGWCGIPVHQEEPKEGPKPFDAGLLTARPAHGTVLIHEVGDDTRIDYTPDRNYSGLDSFSVKLIPGNSILHIAVKVTTAVK